MSDRQTAIELIREGHDEGDRVVAMHVAWEAIATLAAENEAVRATVVELYRIIIDCRDEAKACDKGHKNYRWTNNCILNLTRLSPALEDAALAQLKETTDE